KPRKEASRTRTSKRSKGRPAWREATGERARHEKSVQWAQWSRSEGREPLARWLRHEHTAPTPTRQRTGQHGAQPHGAKRCEGRRPSRPDSVNRPGFSAATLRVRALG